MIYCVTRKTVEPPLHRLGTADVRLDAFAGGFGYQTDGDSARVHDLERGRRAAVGGHFPGSSIPPGMWRQDTWEGRLEAWIRKGSR